MTIHLDHKNILVTRAEPQARAFAEQITRYGGEAIVTPLIKITCTGGPHYQATIDRLTDYEWLIFTSANGVSCFFNQLEKSGRQDLKKYAHLAVVGPKTNQALHAFGYEADFIPSVYNAHTMAQTFLETYQPTGPVLLVQGQLSGTVLEAALQRENVPYDCLTVYETRTNVDVKHDLQHALSTKHIDFITFMSPSTVDAFKELTDDLAGTVQSTIMCIGTTTEKRAREHGFQKVLVPEAFTTEGMMREMHAHTFKKEGDGQYGK